MCTEGQEEEEEESRGLGQKIEKHHRSCCSPTLLLMHTSCLSAHRLPISASLSPNISILAKYAFQSGSVGPSVGQVLVFCIVRPAILSCCPALLSPPLCERHRVPTRLAEVRLHFVPATLHIPALDTEAVGAWCSSTDGLYRASTESSRPTSTPPSLQQEQSQKLGQDLRRFFRLHSARTVCLSLSCIPRSVVTTTI